MHFFSRRNGLSLALLISATLLLAGCRAPAVEAPPTVVFELPENATPQPQVDSVLEPTVVVAQSEDIAKAPVSIESIDGLIAAENYEDALVQIEVALQTASVDIDKLDLTFKKADILVALERGPEALDLLNNSLKNYLTPEEAPLELLLRHAAIAETLNLSTETTQSWRTIALLAPDNEDYQLRSAEFAIATEDYDIAADAYRRLVAIDESNLVYQVAFGKTLQDADLLEEAATVLKNIVEVDAENADAWFNLGINSYLLGADENTKNELQRALELGLSEEDAALVEDLLTDLDS